MREHNSATRILMRQRAGRHMDRAEHLERQGRWEEAMIEFKNAVKLDPQLADAHGALGYHYQRKGLLGKAVEAFRRAALLSDDYDNLYNLGHVLVELGRFTEAETALQRCLVFRRGDPAARYELAYVHYSTGRCEEAIRELNALLDEYPEDWELLSLRASCHLRQRAYAQAEQDLRLALDSTPDDESRALLQENLDTVQRYGEFAPGTLLNTKDRLYANHGSICLGSASDDGIVIPDYSPSVLDYAHLAVILRRFQVLFAQLIPPVTAILPADAEALPLAIALSQVLGLRVTSLETVHENDIPLLVLGICNTPDLYDLILEHSPVEPVSLAVAVDWSQHAEVMTDIVGVFSEGPCSLPWQSANTWGWWPESGVLSPNSLRATPAGRSIMVIVRQIVNRMRRAKREANEDDQVAYYALHHRRLRFRPTVEPGLAPET